MPERERTHKCVNGYRTSTDSYWLYDAKGIALRRVCSKCKQHHISTYDPRVFDSSYVVNEVVDPEDYY
jgi:transcriptional regulator NrdR family protein